MNITEDEELILDLAPASWVAEDKAREERLVALYMTTRWNADLSVEYHGLSEPAARRKAKIEVSQRRERLSKPSPRQLAIEAGLVDPEPPKVAKLVDWFKRSCGPLLDALHEPWVEHDAKQDLLDQECYYDSRSARYSHNRQIHYQRLDQENQQGMGLYEWTFKKKRYRSWLGNEPLATPNQIAGMLLGRYPGFEVIVTLEGYTTTKCAGAALVGGIGVPKYKAHLTPKIPNIIHTAERLYLDFGRVLDLEDARQVEADFEAGLISRELYADTVAKLCRDAPVDEGFNDYRCGIWEELDPKTHEIKSFDTDDTRDAPSDRGDFEFTYWHRDENALDDQGNPVVVTHRVRSQVGNYEWEDMERKSDMDNGQDVQVLLGLSTQQIEETFDHLGDDASIGEFFRNLAPKKATADQAEKLFNSGEIISF